MGTQKEIILATDFLEHSDAAKNAAIQLAEFSQACLHVVHVCDNAFEQQANGAAPWAGPQPWVGDVLERMQKESKENLQSFAKGLSTKAHVQTTLLIGNPANQMKSYLEKATSDISFVVLTKRRRSYFGEFFLGSVAYKVIQHCVYPTLIIPDDIDFSQWQPRHIVVALSLADGTHAALETAIQLAKHFDSKVTLLHTIETNQSPTANSTTRWTAAFAQNNLEAFNAEYFVKNELARYAKEMNLSEERIQIEVCFGSVIETISVAMSALKADLLITGSHTTAGAKRNLLGSIPSTLAHSARFPLLVVRHEGLSLDLEERSR